MNAWLTEISSDPLAQRIGWALVHFLWQGAAVALLLAGALAVLPRRRVRARWVTSCVALALMALLPVATACVVTVTPFQASAPVEAEPADVVIAPPTSVAVPVIPTAPPVEPPSVPIDPELPTDPVPPPLPAAERPGGAEPPAEPAAEAPVVAAASWRDRVDGGFRQVLPWALAVWLAGMGGLTVWHLAGWLQLRRLKRRQVRPVGAALRVTFRRLLGKIRVSRPVRLLESSAVAVPMVIGWFRPVILVPVSVLSGLTPEQLEAVLAHELAHVRRCECLIRLIQAAIETVLFYHPAVWWVSGRVRAEGECCCDEFAVGIGGDRPAYAAALAETARLARRGGRLAAAASDGKLLPRIRRLLGLPDRGPVGAARWFAGAVVVAALVLAGLTGYGSAIGGEPATDDGPAAEAREAVGPEKPGDPPKGTVTPIETPIAAPRLGEVIERTVTGDFFKATAHLDLDTGRYVKLERGDAWATRGIDVATAMGESDSRVRAGADMVAVAVDASRWDSSPRDILRELANAKPQRLVRLGGREAGRTYFFETREGGAGVLQITPAANGAVRVRYRLVRLAKPAAGAPSKGPVTPIEPPMAAPRLGQVIERTLSANHLDLDTGRHFQLMRADEWATRGIDVATAWEESDSRVRAGVDMVTVAVDASRWGSSPQDILRELAKAKPRRRVRLGGGNAGRTYFFETREGGAGVLQITPTAGGDVKVRYRLVRLGKPAAAPRSAVKATLPDGTIVELLGVCDYPPEDRLWWKPNGLPAAPPYDGTKLSILSSMEADMRPVELALKLTGAASEPGWEAGVRRVDRQRVWRTGRPNRGGQYLRNVQSFGTMVKRGRKVTDLALDLAAGPWTTRIRKAPEAPSGEFTLREGMVVISAARSQGGKTLIDVTTPMAWGTQLHMRFVAVDTAGEIHRGVPYEIASLSHWEPVDSERARWMKKYRFPLASKNIKAFRFETRPYHRVEFRNISLQRGHKTECKAVTPATAAANAKAGVLQLRLTAPANTEYRRTRRLPLLLEVKNVGQGPIPPGTLYRARLGVEVTDAAGKPLRVAEGWPIDLTPWEGRFVANGLPAGATLRWTTWFDHLNFLDRPKPGSTVRVRYALRGHELPASNWIELTIKDSPPIALGAGNLPEAWQKTMDLVYRDGGPSGTRAVHVGGDGRVQVIVVQGGKHPWMGRHEAAIGRKHLDRLAILLWRQQVWKLLDLKPEAPNPPERATHLALSVNGRLLAGTFTPQQVQREPALQAIRKEVARLMETTVRAAMANRRGWGPGGADGVHCRLRANKATWPAGRTPTFTASVRNDGMREFSITQAQMLCELQVDGEWYRWAGAIHAKSSPFGPGRQYNDIAVTLANAWRSKTGNRPIALAPGKHTVRIAFLPAPNDGGAPARAVSNAVEIEIAPAEAAAEAAAKAAAKAAAEAAAKAAAEAAAKPAPTWSKPVGGLQCSIRTAKSRFQQWESINLTLTFKNVGKGDLVLTPGSLKLLVAGDGASYHPILGIVPPMGWSLLERIRTLKPGQEAKVEAIGLHDGSGAWALQPGTYRIRVDYRATGEHLPEERPAGRVWTGRLQPPQLHVTVVPTSKMHETLAGMFKQTIYRGGREKVRPALLALGGEADAELLLMLRDRDRSRSTKRHVMWAVGERRIKQAVPDLIARLGSRTQYEPGAAVVALGEIGDRRASDPLLALLDAEAGRKLGRHVILAALRRIGSPEAVPAMRKYARDKDWQTAGGALAGLHVLAGEDTVSPLLNDIARKTPNRPRAHLLLKAMGPDAGDALLKTFRESGDPKQVQGTVTFLRLIFEAGHHQDRIVAAALARVGHPDWAMRFAALDLCRWLTRHPRQPEVVQAAIGRLADEKDTVREVAVSVLRECKDRKAVGPLLAMARDHSRPSDQYGIQALLDFNDPEIERQLLAEYAKGGRNFRWRLFELAGIRVGALQASPRLIRWIEQAAADEKHEFRKVAQHELNRRPDEKTRPGGRDSSGEPSPEPGKATSGDPHGAAPATATRPAGRAVAALRFGPVVERLVSSSVPKDETFLDLDTGLYGRNPPGRDLVCALPLYENDGRVRVGLDMVAIAVDASRWNSSPQEVLREVRKGKRQAKVRLGGNVPRRTFFFETREGSAGVLQITPTAVGGHVNVRYKVVQGQAGTVWGKPVTGLQAGLRMVPLPLQVRVGRYTPPAELVVRNVSKRAMSFTIGRGPHPPVLHTADGREIRSWRKPISRPILPPILHTLPPGKSLRRPVASCLLAPRRPIYEGTATHWLPIGAGRYKLSCALVLGSGREGVGPTRLRTGQLDLDVLALDERELTDRTAKALRERTRPFSLKVVRMADKASPLRSLWLTTYDPKVTLPKHWQTVRIDREQANAIIQHLASAGYLWRTIAEPHGEARSAPPSYFLSVALGDESDPAGLSDLGPMPLGWGPTMMAKLRALRKVLRGDAAGAMDRLLAAAERTVRPAAGLRFGPVLERLVSSSASKDDAFLDLDTGLYGRHLPGRDFMVFLGESDTRVRTGRNMVAIAVAASRWDSSPQEVLREVRKGKRQARARLGGRVSNRTFFFQTAEGGAGVLQITPATGGYAKVRYRLILADTQAEPKVNPAAPAAPADDNAAAPAFRPVVERRLTANTRQASSNLDIDTGTYVDPPTTGVGLRTEFLRQTGIDLYMSGMESWVRSRTASDMVLGQLWEGAWDASATWTAKQARVNIVRNLEGRNASPGRVISAPGTFAFRTREGSIGVMQLTMAQQRPGLMARYRLLAEPGHLKVGNPTWGKAVDGLRVSIEPAHNKRRFAKGQPILITWTVKNFSDKPRTILWHPLHYSPALFGVRRDDGAFEVRVDLRRLVIGSYAAPPQPLVLAPGASKHQTFDLRYFGLDRPGKYELTGLYGPKAKEASIPREYLTAPKFAGAVLGPIIASTTINITLTGGKDAASRPAKLASDEVGSADAGREPLDVRQTIRTLLAAGRRRWVAPSSAAAAERTRSLWVGEGAMMDPNPVASTHKARFAAFEGATQRVGSHLVPGT